LKDGTKLTITDSIFDTHEATKDGGIMYNIDRPGIPSVGTYTDTITFTRV
jgi:hypothetical protein